MTLDGLEADTPARITGVEWAALVPEEAKRLQALGLDAGAEIAVLYRGIFGGRDPIAVRLGRTTIALRRAHARAVTVEPDA